MKHTIILFACLAGLSLLSNAAKQAGAKTWTNPAAAKVEDPDFLIQGEYGKPGSEGIPGVQVIAQGKGVFLAYTYPGGLPGAGWKPDTARVELKGMRDKNSIQLVSADKSVTATISAGKLTLTENKKQPLVIPRIERASPTLGSAAPEDATVLFDGKSAEHWSKGKLVDGLLAAGCTSKSQFGSYRLHLEFRTPYMPNARGQKRGNSGVYHSGRWETQILDTFGLESRDNHCGGIYSISKPRLNMCLPPLAWQTYDVDFTAAKFDNDSKLTAWPKITVRLNGVTIHENLELRKNFTTSAPVTGPITAKGPVYLQDHNNPVVFRNIWIISPK